MHTQRPGRLFQREMEKVEVRRNEITRGLRYLTLSHRNVMNALRCVVQQRSHLKTCMYT